ncbi:MAG: phosphopantothenate/pantothenate synthetase [Candidatus Lokiarchaeota archaeon]|nr:phosphopantothenate/pantothenate synthetase [Candidatus Lokiarchaeota archaeon]MBD3201353.1 phosphopantothenate/pantothenate synthetase [Candidatus Lokiarchaeota archaeon]
MPIKNEKKHNVPLDHPRYESLKYRHRIIEGMKKLVVAEAGLIAHGRGECFDYILGEATTKPSESAIKAASAALLLAKNPIISVNGNVAALIPEKIVKLSKVLNAPLEINLFYRKKGRVEAITELLLNAGAEKLLGTDESKMVEIDELSSNRRNVDPDGIKQSDVVMVPLEDGDRTESLKKIGKKVIAVDLNPISRTALWADITIVDNIIRVIPKMIEVAEELKNSDLKTKKSILKNFDNKENIKAILDLIIDYITQQKKDAFKSMEY